MHGDEPDAALPGFWEARWADADARAQRVLADENFSCKQGSLGRLMGLGSVSRCELSSGRLAEPELARV